MKNISILVTGSKGFVGRNLCISLNTKDRIRVLEYDMNNTKDELKRMLNDADIIYHLAGVNRPQNTTEYFSGNAGLTEEICMILSKKKTPSKIVLASSIQAEQDNPYGKSKQQAEKLLQEYSSNTGASAVAYRFKNLFGKWCRPNYNSVTATFCYNITHGLPITISDPGKTIELTYIDDVVSALVKEIPFVSDEKRGGFSFAPELPSYSVNLARLAELISSFRESRNTLNLPSFDNIFVQSLYATYLSYLESDDFAYYLQKNADERGSLAEMMKSNSFGQIFVSRTKPGITRGNHYHHTKTEKFMVVEGNAIIRLRKIDGIEVIEHHVAGYDFKVVDIPPGYTHHINNIGKNELVTLFWASEIFNPDKPDTYFMKV